MATERSKAAEREAAEDKTTTKDIAKRNANPAHSVASEETAVINSASQSSDPELTDKIKRARGEGVANLSQGENANGEKDAEEKAEEPNFSKAEVSTQGGTKILREEGAPPDPNFQGHVVQQGGGGVVAPSGEPIR